MPVQAVTHLNFQGQARAALAFYQSVFGGQVTQFSYRESGMPHDPADAERIIWGQVSAANGFRIMAYDVPAGEPWAQGRRAFFVALGGDSGQEIRSLWDKLSEGASIEQPLAPAQWAPLYGMLEDRFGVVWVVNVVGTPGA